MSSNRYLVVSDLHLCDVEDHPDGWKRHKGSEYLFDDDFRSLVREFRAELTEEESPILILNGDIFDFDLVTAVPGDPPWPVSALERRHGLVASAPKSAWKLQHMLAEHPVFMRTLAELLAGGGRVVYVLGNHDRELHFPEVQEVFLDALEDAAAGNDLSVDRGDVTFEPWFYYVPGEVYAEHGHQYDFYSSFRYLLDPVVEEGGEERLALPMGNLANRFLLSNIGYFNPHSGDFIQGVFGYLLHWLRFYAFSRRSLVLTWLGGSLRSIAHLVRIKQRLLRHPPRDYDARLAAVADRFDLPVERVQALYELRMPPVTNRWYRIVREFWLDRVLIAVLMTLGTVAIALSGAPLWAKIMVPLTGFPLLHFLYEWFAGDDNAVTVEFHTHSYAHAIARLLPCRAVTFGHTHLPNVIPLAQDRTYANTGTWAPTWGQGGDGLAVGLRNYLVVSFEGDRCRADLGSWTTLGSGRSKTLAEDRPRR